MFCGDTGVDGTADWPDRRSLQREPDFGRRPWRAPNLPRPFHLAGPADALYQAHARKPIKLPPAVARCFVEDLRAFFAEPNPIKRDEIASRQMSVVRQYQGPREKADSHS